MQALKRGEEFFRLRHVEPGAVVPDVDRQKAGLLEARQGPLSGSPDDECSRGPRTGFWKYRRPTGN